MKGIVNYYLGLSHYNSGNYELALMYIHRTLDYWEPLSNLGNAPRWNALEMLGNTYAKLKQFDKAIDLHKQALMLRRITFTGLMDESVNLAFAYSYNNLAECYLEKGIMDTAHYFADKSLRIKLRPAAAATDDIIGNSYLNVAKILF